MNTNQLECFLAVAESLNFARAAEQLHITQPAVTHQINSLETELGARLFIRTTRNVEMTQAGFHFLGDAQDILGMANSAKARISQHFPEQISPFLIGCHMTTDYELLPPVLKQLKEEWPQFHPLIKQAPFQVLLNQLQEESLHVMFGFREDQREKKSAGIFTFLADAPICCITAPYHPLAAKKVLTLEDLKSGGLLATNPRRTSPSIASAIAPLVGQRPPSDMYFCDDPAAMFTFAKAGLGFALFPYIPSAMESSFCCTPVKGLPTMKFGLYYKNKKTHPALSRFIQLMQQQVP